jgi:hypothetical protein
VNQANPQSHRRRERRRRQGAGRYHATVGEPVTLDAEGTRDPDGDTLRFRWFFYPEAGTGIPGQPVARTRARAMAAARLARAFPHSRLEVRVNRPHQ